MICYNHPFSSKKSNNVNIILRFSDPILGVMDSAFVISKIIVKAPTHGFTAPCMFYNLILRVNLS
jgi:hypothetical protein